MTSSSSPGFQLLPIRSAICSVSSSPRIPCFTKIRFSFALSMSSSEAEMPTVGKTPAVAAAPSACASCSGCAAGACSMAPASSSLITPFLRKSSMTAFASPRGAAPPACWRMAADSSPEITPFFCSSSITASIPLRGTASAAARQSRAPARSRVSMQVTRTMLRISILVSVMLLCRGRAGLG